LDEARGLIEQAQARGIQSSSFHGLLLNLAWIQGDSAGMKKQLDWIANAPGAGVPYQNEQAQIATSAGQLAKTHEISRQAIGDALRSDDKERAAILLVSLGHTDALAGNSTLAQQEAQKALEYSSSDVALSAAAMAFALAGNPSKAEPLDQQVAQRNPDATILQRIVLPDGRAAIALARGNAAQAIDGLQSLLPYQYGEVDSLLSASLRGEAFLAEKKGPEAAAEFQRVVDHRAILLGEVTYPLAYLGLARARVLSGDTPGARKAYQDFFAIWKDADSDIPILKQAKTEYAKLAP
jgi:urease accessory protein UreF